MKIPFGGDSLNMHGGQMLCKANFYKKQLADTTKAVIRLLRLIWRPP